MFTERTSVGLDVHARSVVGCGLDTVTGETARRRVVPTFEGVTDWLAELPAPVAVAYEAGPTGVRVGAAVDRGGDPVCRGSAHSIGHSQRDEVEGPDVGG